jgi:predicted GNAT superfamily acetyltransferase
VSPEPDRPIHTSSSEVRLRTLDSIGEMSQLVDLQREIWGYGEPNTDFPYPARALFALAESGGHVGGAFLDDHPVGLSVAWRGVDPVSQMPYLHSQLVGVRKEQRHLGIGFQLKLYQRDFALEANLALVKWVFDPMRSINGNLNVRKLGAVIPAYHPDYYGSVQSHFSRGLATDRVWAHWYVASSRVRQRLSDPPPLLEQEPALVQVATLPDPDLECSEPEFLVEVPQDFDAILQESLSRAADGQAKVREIFQHYLHKGYLAADFLVVSGPPRRTFYLFTKNPLKQILNPGYA